MNKKEIQLTQELEKNIKYKSRNYFFLTFDFLHAVDVKMLDEVQRQCNYLIAVLQIDSSIDRSKKNAPSESIVERYI